MFGRIVHARLASRVLEGNPLGDPSLRDVVVVLPPTYDEVRRFPVVILLPGYAGTPLGFLEGSPWKRSVVERFDAQIASGASKPAVLVLPDCGTRWGGSQFLDSAATGAYQTYLADEVVPFVDATFRTVPVREARAVAGRSSGGFGALRLALDRPDRVAAFAAHAADADFDVTMRPQIPTAAVAVARAGGLGPFLASLAQNGPRDGLEFDAAFLVAASAAYAPSAGAAPLGAEVPFDASTGETREDVFARFRAHDPLVRIAEAPAETLAGLAAIFVDAGRGDEHALGFAAAKIASRLEARGARVRYEAFEGGHRGTAHRYEVSLPYLVDALATT